MCSELGFHCISVHGTVFLGRRQWPKSDADSKSESDCTGSWESIVINDIYFGCECMRPTRIKPNRG